jgi:hypothetical protein
MMPAGHLPFLQAATCLSRVRSEMISHSNCAKDSRVFKSVPQGGVGVELLRDRDEADGVLLKQAHHLGEIDQRTTEAINLVYDNAIDLAGFDVGRQLV